MCLYRNAFHFISNFISFAFNSIFNDFCVFFSLSFLEKVLILIQLLHLVCSWAVQFHYSVRLCMQLHNVAVQLVLLHYFIGKFLWTCSYDFCSLFSMLKKLCCVEGRISHNDMIKCRLNRPDKIHRIRESNTQHFKRRKLALLQQIEWTHVSDFEYFLENKYVPWKITAYLLKLSQCFCPYGLAFSFLQFIIINRDVRDDNQTVQLEK